MVKRYGLVTVLATDSILKQYFIYLRYEPAQPL